MSTWTLAADESGSFDSAEPHAFLVGGVLLPKPADKVEDLRGPLQAWCKKQRVDYPPHATALRREGQWRVTDELVALSARWLASHKGSFVGVLCKRVASEADAAVHARMLGAFIELSGRLAAAGGASSLDLRPASRSFFLQDERVVDSARQAGLVVEQRKRGGFFHGVLGTEARESLDALARSAKGRLSPWPLVHSIVVATASSEAVHPGVLASDYFCNRTYAATRKKASTTRRELTEGASWDPRSVLIVDYHLLHLVRSLDEALRLEPPHLHQLGVALTKIELARQTFQADGSRLFLGAEGTSAVAELLLAQGEKRLLEACRADKNLTWAIAQRLAGDAQSELDLKHGDYEGTRRALELGFSGKSELAQLLRGISDRELVARLYRLTLECSNHVGDGASSTWAREGFASTFAGGASLALLGEALRVENLTNVALQNELPCPAEGAPALLASISESARKLRDLAERLSQPVLSFAPPAAPDAPKMSDEERELRELTGLSATWARSDREYGRCLGTSARSLAFVGDLDGARGLALAARGHFQDSPFDLAFNAAVLARIELERARTAPESTQESLLRHLLRLSGAEALRDAARLETALESDPAQRFALELLLRQLLWAPHVSDAGVDRALIDSFGRGASGPLYTKLRSLRSHPTEMIARHVGELLRIHQRGAKAVQSWFELSLELTAASPMPTLQRLAAFTSWLQQGGAAEGPPGSLRNPTFEYR
jgi:hypothetical protein